MVEVLSQHNPLVKDLTALKQAKARREHNLILIETLHPVEEAIRAKLDIVYVLLREDRADELLGNPKIQRCSESTEFRIVSEDILRRIATTDSAPEILAIANRPELAIKTPTDESVLALYQLQDPGNIGALVRSALAFGVKHIALVSESSHVTDPFHPKIIRSSAGLIFRVQLSTCDSLAQLAEDAPIIALDAKAETSLLDFEWPQNAVILLGSEGAGLPANLPENTTRLSIPMTPDAESLNVAIAGSLVLSARYNFR